MNRETLDFLSAAELSDIASDVADLLDDTQISRGITYKDFQSRTFSASAGTSVATYTETATRAIRIEMGAREVKASEGLYQMGDVVYYIAQSDLSVTPHREDRIVDGLSTYEVIIWQTDPLGQLWKIVAREVS